MSLTQFNEQFPIRDNLSAEAEVVSLSLRAEPSLGLQDALGAILAFGLTQRTNGRFILHLDDTDPDSLQTQTPKAQTPNKILNLLFWLKITPDEFYDLGGYGPYVWRDRQQIYQEVALQLIEQGHAYHCFCHTRLEATNRIFQQHMPHDPCRSLSFEELYDRLTKGDKYVIRFRAPSHASARDELTQPMGDFPLLTPQGLPMPYFAHVVDNHFMHVTTQVRRANSRSMIAEETLLYQALGWEMPKQVYTPYIEDPNSPYLFEETCLSHFKQQGYLPESLRSALTHLIWSPANYQEAYPFADFVTCFDYSTALPDQIVFDYELLDRLQKWYAMNKM